MSWRSNDTLNNLSPFWLEVDFSRLFGGWLDIKLKTMARAGDKLYYYLTNLWYYWIGSGGQILFSSSVNGREINSPSLPLLHEAIWSSVMSNLSNPVDAYLRVAVEFYFIHQPTPADPPQYYRSVTMVDVSNIRYCKPPDKIVANPPDSPPVRDTWSNCYCGLDFSGPNTQFMAEYSKADGSNSVIIPYQSSNLFSIKALDYPQTRWRARAKNDIGEGEWSDWCYFPTIARIEGYVAAQVQPILNKSSHWFRASLHITSGHVINSLRWIVTQRVGSVLNTILDVDGVQYTSVEYLLENTESLAEYCAAVVVRATKPGDPGMSYTALYGYANYYPEGLEP